MTNIVDNAKNGHSGLAEVPYDLYILRLDLPDAARGRS
jgi:hypothetical protein